MMSQRFICNKADVSTFVSTNRKRPDSLWHALIDSLLQQNFNQSMMITKQMFMNGQTIDQIMAIRHLKEEQ